MLTPIATNYAESFYNKNGYDRIYYSTNHVLPFLLEQFLNIPKGSNILYLGCNQSIFYKIEEFCLQPSYMHKLYYQQAIPAEEEITQQNLIYKLKTKSASLISFDEITHKIDLIIFDFGIEKKLLNDYASVEFIRRIIDNQSHFLTKIAFQESTKIIKTICINVHNTRYYKNVKKFLNPIQNPYCSGIMVGRIVDNKVLLKRFYKDIFFKKICQVRIIGNILFRDFKLLDNLD